jgi:hypothetical protein
MTTTSCKRGAAPVGVISDLDATEAAAVIYFRLWCSGPEAQAQVRSDFIQHLGHTHGMRTAETLDRLCRTCVDFGRRPLMCHSVRCTCLGADESCFATFVASAGDGCREDAMLIATLLVRVDMAPVLTALGTDFCLGLKRMQLSTPGEVSGYQGPASSTVH